MIILDFSVAVFCLLLVKVYVPRGLACTPSSAQAEGHGAVLAASGAFACASHPVGYWV